MAKINLTFLRRTNLLDLYGPLLTDDSLGENDRERLLKVAVIFLNSDDLDVRQFGYRIVLLYANRFNDYQPLYDLSINLGLGPISNLIHMRPEISEAEIDFWKTWNKSSNEYFNVNGKYFTSGQYDLHNSYINDVDSDMSVIAPTSYGKSELMLSDIQKELGNVCVLLPTKALLAQTKKRIMASDYGDKQRKIITHPEMYKESDSGIIAVFTQERLLRLLQLFPKVVFDLVIVDEAHNLLESGGRAQLLASTIIFLKKRNSGLRIRFLTPFLIEANSLQVEFTDFETKAIHVKENVKSEKVYSIDFTAGGVLEIYDQFLDEFINVETDSTSNPLNFVIEKKGPKNVVYLNKPISVEDFAKSLERKSVNLNIEEIQKACTAISEYLHKDYFLVKCLSRGICYHHGSVPDIVKLYIEHLYKENSSLHTIVTNSTLLEGVNIPADTLFILDAKKGRSLLSASQLKNLVGRICRFSEIFNTSTGNLRLLEPRIFVLKSSYTNERFNLQKFISDRLKIGKKISDSIENVLLKKAKITAENAPEKKEAVEFIANLEPGIVESITVRMAKTKFGQLCFMHSVTDIPILDVEVSCQSLVDAIKANGIVGESGDDILSLIEEIFLPFATSYDLQKLQNDGAMDFYSMFAGMKMTNASLGQMIANFMSYWRRKEKEDPIIFVGNKWGEITKDGHRVPAFVDLKSKSEAEKINLAIVRIKEEQDYFENTLMKLIEVLNDLGLITQSTYFELKYGTTNVDRINLIKNGVSPGLANILIAKYKSFVRNDEVKGLVSLDPNIFDQAEFNRENELVKFELKLNFKQTS